MGGICSTNVKADVVAQGNMNAASNGSTTTGHASGSAAVNVSAGVSLNPNALAAAAKTANSAVAEAKQVQKEVAHEVAAAKQEVKAVQAEVKAVQQEVKAVQQEAKAVQQEVKQTAQVVQAAATTVQQVAATGKFNAAAQVNINLSSVPEDPKYKGIKGDSLWETYFAAAGQLIQAAYAAEFANVTDIRLLVASMAKQTDDIRVKVLTSNVGLVRAIWAYYCSLDQDGFMNKNECALMMKDALKLGGNLMAKLMSVILVPQVCYTVAAASNLNKEQVARLQAAALKDLNEVIRDTFLQTYGPMISNEAETAKIVEKMWVEFDDNKDGKVDMQEFGRNFNAILLTVDADSTREAIIKKATPIVQKHVAAVLAGAAAGAAIAVAAANSVPTSASVSVNASANVGGASVNVQAAASVKA